MVGGEENGVIARKSRPNPIELEDRHSNHSTIKDINLPETNSAVKRLQKRWNKIKAKTRAKACHKSN